VNKILWIDTETTGLKPWENGIIQLAGFIEVGGELKDEFNYTCAPFPRDIISPYACEVHGIAESVFRTYPCPKAVKKDFTTTMDKYVNKYNKEDKFIIGGYNTKFDINFLNHWFKKQDDPYFFSYAFVDPIDVLAMIRGYFKQNGIKLENNKLTTVARYFEIEVDFHDAMGDIMATYMIYKILQGLNP
jgi:DNA polymerase III subunit epsilon